MIFGNRRKLFELGIGPVFEAPPAEAPSSESPPDGSAGGGGGEAGDGGIGDRMRQLREAQERGEDVLEVARKTAKTGDEGRPAKIEGEPDARGEGEEEDSLTELERRFQEEDKYRTQGEDPEGTYRDEAGRLRDKVTHKFVSPRQDQDEGEELAGEGEEELEAEAAEEGEEELEEGEDPLVVELPGQHEDEDPLEIRVEDEDAARRIRMLKNGFMRKEEVRRQLSEVQADRDELQFIEDEIRRNPSDFLIERIPAETQTQVAERILASLPEDQFNAIADRVFKWDRDPRARETEAIRTENETLKRRQERESTRREQLQVAQEARAIASSVVDLIPEGWSETQADVFYDAAISQIEKYGRQNQLETLAPEEVPVVLERLGVLETFGVPSPGDSATTDGNGKRPGESGPKRPGSSARPPEARRVGEDLKARADRRKEASTVTPAGVGAGSPGGLTPPKGQGVEERLQWLRKNQGRLSF